MSIEGDSAILKQGPFAGFEHWQLLLWFSSSANHVVCAIPTRMSHVGLDFVDIVAKRKPFVLHERASGLPLGWDRSPLED